MSKNVYHIGSGALTFEIIERIINENLKLELAPEAKLRIQKCRDYLDHKIASSEEPLYGITTGFGSLCTKNISPDELGTLQENLIKSHACSVGEEIRPVIIKLMMLLKAHALSLGHSGVQVITVQRILDFFNNDVMPIVYDRGSLGASGDLAPLANLFLPLIGVGDVYYKGKKCEAISVLDEFGWEPVKLMSKEGLALLNGTQFMSANGVFAMLKAFRLSKKADLIAALSLEAFDGRIDPFMDCIQQIRPHQGQIETGEAFRTAAQAIGYKEFFPYFEQTAALDACTEKLKQASRNYAKRQLTWFRHMDGVTWLDAGAADVRQTALRLTQDFLLKG